MYKHMYKYKFMYMPEQILFIMIRFGYKGEKSKHNSALNQMKWISLFRKRNPEVNSNPGLIWQLCSMKSSETQDHPAHHPAIPTAWSLTSWSKMVVSIPGSKLKKNLKKKEREKEASIKS